MGWSEDPRHADSALYLDIVGGDTFCTDPAVSTREFRGGLPSVCPATPAALFPRGCTGPGGPRRIVAGRVSRSRTAARPSAHPSACRLVRPLPLPVRPPRRHELQRARMRRREATVHVHSVPPCSPASTRLRDPQRRRLARLSRATHSFVAGRPIQSRHASDSSDVIKAGTFGPTHSPTLSSSHPAVRPLCPVSQLDSVRIRSCLDRRGRAGWDGYGGLCRAAVGWSEPRRVQTRSHRAWQQTPYPLVRHRVHRSTLIQAAAPDELFESVVTSSCARRASFCSLSLLCPSACLSTCLLFMYTCYVFVCLHI